ncbi:unnamed protein product [Lathyrus sativus]|nr:unnamed protein product [Lathyrus sativus]
MAPISKLLSFLFLTTLSFSLQIHARDSKFFSKVTHVNNNLNDNNQQPLNKPEQQQQPVFIPETENSYGLYGHESGLHPPTTTTSNNVVPNTYQSYQKTSPQDENNNVNNYFTTSQKDSYTNKYPNEISDTKLTPTSYNNNNNNNNYDKYFYNNNKYASNEVANTKFPEEAYNSMENQNNNNNNDKYYYNNNKYASNELTNAKFPEEGYNSMENQNNKYYYNNNVAAKDKYYFKTNGASNNNYNNGERQGMSDTRVMEGGKYFYDVNSEKYNPTLFNGDSSKGVVNSENWYNKKGYFGSNNNVNTYENNKNSMNGYQNQEEFESDQEEFEP